MRQRGFVPLTLQGDDPKRKFLAKTDKGLETSESTKNIPAVLIE